MALANTVGDRSVLPPPKIRSTFLKQTALFFIVLSNEEQVAHSFFIASVLSVTTKPKVK